MIRHDDGCVIAIRASAAAHRRARREVDALIGAAREDLVAAGAGDLVRVHSAWINVGRAVCIVMKYGLDIDGLAS